MKNYFILLKVIVLLTRWRKQRYRQWWNYGNWITLQVTFLSVILALIRNKLKSCVILTLKKIHIKYSSWWKKVYLFIYPTFSLNIYLWEQALRYLFSWKWNPCSCGGDSSWKTLYLQWLFCIALEMEVPGW